MQTISGIEPGRACGALLFSPFDRRKENHPFVGISRSAAGDNKLEARSGFSQALQFFRQSARAVIDLSHPHVYFTNRIRHGCTSLFGPSFMGILSQVPERWQEKKSPPICSLSALLDSQAFSFKRGADHYNCPPSSQTVCDASRERNATRDASHWPAIIAATKRTTDGESEARAASSNHEVIARQVRPWWMQSDKSVALR